MDVKSAFWNGLLKEKVLVRQLPIKIMTIFNMSISLTKLFMGENMHLRHGKTDCKSLS